MTSDIGMIKNTLNASTTAVDMSYVLKPKVESKETPKVSLPVKAKIEINSEEKKKNIQMMLDHLNSLLQDGGRGLNFAIDKALGSTVVVVTNKESGEVIRQIPDEVVVRLAHNIEKLKGMLQDEKI